MHRSAIRGDSLSTHATSDFYHKGTSKTTTHTNAPEAEAGAGGDENVAGVQHEAAGGPRGVHGADGCYQLDGEGPEELFREALRGAALPVGGDVPVCWSGRWCIVFVRKEDLETRECIFCPLHAHHSTYTHAYRLPTAA